MRILLEEFVIFIALNFPFSSCGSAISNLRKRMLDANTLVPLENGMVAGLQLQSNINWLSIRFQNSHSLELNLNTHSFAAATQKRVFWFYFLGFLEIFRSNKTKTRKSFSKQPDPEAVKSHTTLSMQKSERRRLNWILPCSALCTVFPAEPSVDSRLCLRFVKSVALFAFAHEFPMDIACRNRCTFDIGTHASASLTLSIRTPKRTSLFIHFVCDAFFPRSLCVHLLIFDICWSCRWMGCVRFFGIFLLFRDVSTFNDVRRMKKLVSFLARCCCRLCFVCQLFIYAGYNQNFDVRLKRAFLLRKHWRKLEF